MKIYNYDISSISRNKKLEKELQGKILKLLGDPKYEELPMLVINRLRLETNGGNPLLDLSGIEDPCFIILRNLFETRKSEEDPYNSVVRENMGAIEEREEEEQQSCE